MRYITPSDNRGAGSWVGHKLDDYPDGTKVKFIVN
ncbi:competence protein [Paenibacillus terrae]|uniref:Competence protein n=1 Tax=Paenibacillus terrae TaxID=159743 RepID=A0A4U2Q5Z2_9BACL|nr:competence protein [Paenibacillus terrae]